METLWSFGLKGALSVEKCFTAETRTNKLCETLMLPRGTNDNNPQEHHFLLFSFGQNYSWVSLQLQTPDTTQHNSCTSMNFISYLVSHQLCPSSRSQKASLETECSRSSRFWPTSWQNKENRKIALSGNPKLLDQDDPVFPFCWTFLKRLKWIAS